MNHLHTLAALLLLVISAIIIAPVVEMMGESAEKITTHTTQEEK